MPASQITKPTPVRAQFSGTFAASAALGTQITSNIAIPVGAPVQTQLLTPLAQYYYITSFYLQAGTTPSGVHAILSITSNLQPQPFTVQEDEIQQSIFNKLSLSPASWVHLPSGQVTQFFLTNTATTTGTITVNIFATFLIVPVQLTQ
jgi:hypothetical protein